MCKGTIFDANFHTENMVKHTHVVVIMDDAAELTGMSPVDLDTWLIISTGTLGLPF